MSVQIKMIPQGINFTKEPNGTVTVSVRAGDAIVIINHEETSHEELFEKKEIEPDEKK